MTFSIGLAQIAYPADDDVLAQVRAVAAEAASRGVDLLVFPENLMATGELSADELRLLAEPLDGGFIQAVGAIARKTGLWVVATLYETNASGGQPYNTAVVLDDAGRICGCYRKCHLYDAHGVRESDRMSAGSELGVVVETPFCNLGLAICYDLRFPEAFRALALAGCDLAVLPACWHAGPQKAEHWETLIRSRAIENGFFVAGAGHAGERYVGESLIADPLGCVIAKGPAGDEETLVVCEIDLEAVESARDAMPMLSHRRPELYGSVGGTAVHV